MFEYNVQFVLFCSHYTTCHKHIISYKANYHPNYVYYIYNELICYNKC